MPPVQPRTAIIGAGSSGIAAAKALLDRGVDFVSYEASDLPHHTPIARYFDDYTDRNRPASIPIGFAPYLDSPARELEAGRARGRGGVAA